MNSVLSLFPFLMKTHRRTTLMLTQTGWVSRFTVLWVTGRQPVTLCWTSPDTPDCPERNTQYLLSFGHETTSCVGKESSVSVCSDSKGGSVSVPMCHFFLLYHSIPTVMYHLTVPWHIGSCMFVRVCVSTHGRGYVGQEGFSLLASCPHLLHCHHVCCVDVTTTPASLLSLLPQRHCENTSPPWFPDVGHTQFTGRQPIRSPFPYANDTHKHGSQTWLTVTF